MQHPEGVILRIRLTLPEKESHSENNITLYENESYSENNITLSDSESHFQNESHSENDSYSHKAGTCVTNVVLVRKFEL